MVGRLLAFSALLAVFCSQGGQEVSRSRTGSSIDELCDPQGQPLDNYVLRLNESKYTVANDSHCMVENVQNITIIGNSNLTTILCLKASENITSSIFSFINVTSLTIQNIHFEGCGASLTPDDDLKYLRENARSYFGPGQAAAVLCSHCKDLSLSNVQFTRNTGYSFIGINLYGNSVLDRLHVYGGDDERYSPDDPRCNQTGKEYVCSNRGVFLFFTGSELTTLSHGNVSVVNSDFDSNSYNSTNTSSNEDAITSQAWCVRNVFGEFINPQEFYVQGLLPDVGALTIIYIQQDFTASVNIHNNNFTDNEGLCFGAIFSLLLTASPGQVQQTIEGCYFTGNSPFVVPYGEGRNYLARSITVYMKFEGDFSSADDTIWIVNCSFKCGDNNITSPSLSIIHFPTTKGQYYSFTPTETAIA